MNYLDRFTPSKREEFKQNSKQLNTISTERKQRTFQ